MKHYLTLIFSIFPFLLFSQSLNDLSFGEEGSFEAISWNLEFFPKNDQITIDSTALAISQLQADVLALQEIDDISAFQQLDASLDDYTGYIIAENYSNLKLAYLVKNDVQVVSCNSILTSSTYNYMFAGRPPLLLEVIHGGNTFFIINVHLKCCGDGSLDTSDSSDQENRRWQAVNQIKSYIDNYLSNERVIVLGDFNDLLQDTPNHNVFQSVLDDTQNFLFTDLIIANSSSENWSYPSWPSHLDHILITNELFIDFENSYNNVQTILIDDYFANGFSAYDNCISDHRPVGLKLWSVSTIQELLKPKGQLVEIRNLSGQKDLPKKSQLQLYLFQGGQVEKNIIIE